MKALLYIDIHEDRDTLSKFEQSSNADSSIVIHSFMFNIISSDNSESELSDNPDNDLQYLNASEQIFVQLFKLIFFKFTQL